MATEQERIEAVDELADKLDPDDVLAAACRIGMTVPTLLARVSQEIQDRLEG